MSEDSCVSCRHHRKEIREIVVREVVDTVVEMDDTPFYLCTSVVGPYAGKEVGTQPVLCSAHEPARTLDTSALDARMKQALERLAQRGEGEPK